MKHFTLEKIERPGKPQQMTLDACPMVVWVDRSHRLTILKGAKLRDIVNALTLVLPLDLDTRYQLVAYWFALGERRAWGDPSTGWQKKELRTSPKRRYLSAASRKHLGSDHVPPVQPAPPSQSTKRKARRAARRAAARKAAS
jgi:hypothetical protein